MKELEARLNAAAAKAGLPAGYTLTAHTDHTDCYADYIGYRVEGPDLERAHAWLIAAVRKNNATLPTPRHSSGLTRYATVRTGKLGSETFEYLCRARYCIGD